MSAEFIRGILTKIHESQKGLRVQTSIHLEKMEKYLFEEKAHPPLIIE